MTRPKFYSDMPDFPARARLDKITDPEAHIYNVIQEVEHLGAHPLLTDCVTLLGQAKDKLADWLERDIESMSPSEVDYELRLAGIDPDALDSKVQLLVGAIKAKGEGASAPANTATPTHLTGGLTGRRDGP